MTPRLRDYWHLLTLGVSPSEHPEFYLIKDEEVRAQILGRFNERQQQRALFLVFIVIATTFLSVISNRCVVLYPLSLLPPWFASLLCYLILCVSATAVLTFWRYKTLPSYIRTELRRRGWLVCMHCGYNLQEQQTPRCPECGRPFDTTGLGKPGEEPAPDEKAPKASLLDTLRLALVCSILAGIFKTRAFQSVKMAEIAIVVVPVLFGLVCVLGTPLIYLVERRNKQRNLEQRRSPDQGRKKTSQTTD